MDDNSLSSFIDSNLSLFSLNEYVELSDNFDPKSAALFFGLRKLAAQPAAKTTVSYILSDWLNIR